MSTTIPLTDSSHGYLSEASKRRFTLVAGVLGALFFIAQFVLPMALVFVFMMPMLVRQAAVTADIGGAALWRGDLWYVERTVRLNLRAPEESRTERALRRVRVSDLEPVGGALPLEASSSSDQVSLLPLGERLWLIGADATGYYEGEALHEFSRAKRPPRSSRPFAFGGRPAVISLGTEPSLAVLTGRGAALRWERHPLVLGLPPEAGSLRAVQGIEDERGVLHLVAELCFDDDQPCSLQHRELTANAWVRLVREACACGEWAALLSRGRPAVLVSAGKSGPAAELTLVTLAPSGPKEERVPVEGDRRVWTRSRALSTRDGLILVSEGMPGSLSLLEIADGKVVRSLRKQGSFPFPSGMMLLMTLPQLLPIALSLLLALVLSAQMRRHRVRQYVSGGSTRAFASLWQRALAQLVDAVPLAAGLALPGLFAWRMVSDPERLLDEGPLFPLRLLGLILAAFACALLVLVAYSWFEGRSGRTPGKWLLGIRVLGTDLRPCGFGRALLRNMLTLVDGFFNFLVGVMLVALTENWQRLGDLAARTIVVVDERSA